MEGLKEKVYSITVFSYYFIPFLSSNHTGRIDSSILWWVSICTLAQYSLAQLEFALTEIGSSAPTRTHCAIWKRHGSLLSCTFTHTSAWENPGNEVATLTFAAKASTLAVEFPLFSRTCIYATSISMTASLFTRLSRAILLNKTVFNSDDLILKVIQDATERTLRRRGCGTN